MPTLGKGSSGNMKTKVILRKVYENISLSLHIFVTLCVIIIDYNENAFSFNVMTS